MRDAATHARTVTTTRWSRPLTIAYRLLSYAERTVGSLVDVALRAWIGQAFLFSGLGKALDFAGAVQLATTEYPVSWLTPASAAVLGLTAEIAGGLALTLGLGARTGAMALLILSLLAQGVYIQLDIHLFWAAVLGWYVLRGVGPISFDHVLARGLAHAPVPYVASLIAAGAWLRRAVGPLYTLMLRLWIAAALVPTLDAIYPMLPSIVPSTTAAPLAGGLAIPAIGFLVTGLLTRPVAMALVGMALTRAFLLPAADNAEYWSLILMLLVAHGAGAWSLDHLVLSRLKARFPELVGKAAFDLGDLPQVVIVGAGFGGIACATALRSAPARVTLIDRQNYHLFQPLLYQVATAGLAPGDIAATIRTLFRDQHNASVVLGAVTGIDTSQQEVQLGERRIAYDYLVLATGASHSYFGKDHWAPFAPGLKRVDDATAVRRRILMSFEQAENAVSVDERRRLLNFVIVGGGPTGVELAGAIAELARHGMEREFRNFDPSDVRVILVQSGSRILPTFPEDLSQAAQTALEAMGVTVMTDSAAENIDAEGVIIKGQRIYSRSVLWAAGVVASPAARWLSADADRAGRVKVSADLSVPGLPNVFVIGDTAASNAWNGNGVPGLAPAAKQGGQYVAKLIAARITARPEPQPFAYKHMGSLATIGRKAAVADFGFVKLKGALAWWLWGFVHVAFLVGVRNRVSVVMDWIWSYVTFSSGARLITGDEPPT